MTAKIIPDNKDAVWLLLQRGDNIIQNAELQYIKGVKRSEDTSEKVAYALLFSELEAVRDAIEEYLEKVSQEEMLPPFEVWIKKTKPYGGTREEYDRLKEAK